MAGVSTATVSRTLSHPERVSKETRDVVMAAVRDTGYRLNHTARNLRRQRAGSIVALVPRLANPFFSEILAGMAEVLSEAGYGLLVADTEAAPEAGRRRGGSARGRRSNGSFPTEAVGSPRRDGIHLPSR